MDSSSSDYDKICIKQKKQPTQTPNYLFNHLELNKSMCETPWLKDFTHTYQECRNVLLSTDDVLFLKQIISNMWLFCNLLCFFLKKQIATYIKAQEQFSDWKNQQKKTKPNHSEFEIHLFIKKNDTEALL